jgi:glycerophosphoryl diester phosphodiesterase
VKNTPLESATMWNTVRTLFVHAAGDVRASWRSLAATDIVYKAIAFAVLVPATTLLLYWLRAGTSNRVVADVDIVLFFFTTPVGVITLIFGSALIIAISAIEAACLMTIGLGRTQGVTISAWAALRFAAARSHDVLRLTVHMVLRVLAGLIPFVLAAGAVYLTLLRDHDINYYLAMHPPQFWIAIGIVVPLAMLLLVLVVRTAARWALALPLVLFEGVSPRKALGISAHRAAGSYSLIVATLIAWAIGAAALIASTSWLLQFVGRAIAPQFADSLVLLLLFVATLALIGAGLALVIGIVNFATFALLIVQLYLRIGEPNSTKLDQPALRSERRFSPRALAGVAAVALLVAIGVVLVGFLANRGESRASIIAHRGASLAAPENTLAAFNLAAEQRTDFIELDVQESADGEVVVVHDSDLMKVGGAAIKIWEGDAASLRSIDIGSFKNPSFANERVPTLAEALAACKGRCRVIVELKSYGHNQQLEERVVEVVEEAGMQNDCVFMSLDHSMVRRMKSLRPEWRVGLLVAKAIGDLTELKADFLAVEARMATRSFIRRAHRAGQDVYIWTVNDPAWMFVGLSRGVDGLITDKPDVARQVIELRAQMSEPQRFLVAQLIRFGASTETLAAESALRP